MQGPSAVMCFAEFFVSCVMHRLKITPTSSASGADVLLTALRSNSCSLEGGATAVP